MGANIRTDANVLAYRDSPGSFSECMSALELSLASHPPRRFRIGICRGEERFFPSAKEAFCVRAVSVLAIVISYV
jgi:hypothetical protein